MKTKVYGLLRNSVQIPNMIKILYKLKRESKRQKIPTVYRLETVQFFLLNNERIVSTPCANHEQIICYRLKHSSRVNGHVARLNA